MFLACSFIHQTIVFCQFPCGVSGALFSSQTLCPTKALATQGGASKAMGPRKLTTFFVSKGEREDFGGLISD